MRDSLLPFLRKPPLFFESTGLFVGLGFALKKKAFVGRGRAAGAESGANGGGTSTSAMAMAGAGGGEGGLAHLADFKWWIGLTAIGLGAQVND